LIASAYERTLHRRADDGVSCSIGSSDRLTASTFTVVQEDGIMMTKAERLAQFKAQKPTAFAPRTQERIVRYGDTYVARFLSGGTWILEVWVREDGRWKAAAVQVTTAKK
jgi:hypothetical protein